MIDRIRAQLEQRLHELVAEADKLRGALTALGPNGGTAGARRTRSASATASASTRPSRSRARGRQRQHTGGSSNGAPAAQRVRGGSGETKRAVLLALSSGEAMTASDVAAATGLGRGTVSTTLSKMAKTGEVSKAQRGYQIAQPATPTTPDAGK